MVTAVCLIPVAIVMIIFRNVVLGAATAYVLICVALILVGTGWQMALLGILLTVLAGATYLFGFRRQISALIRDKQWRRLLSFRFVE